MMNPKSPREVLNAITQWAKVKEDIRAVLLTSTRAVPNAHVDILSDYDVILIVQDVHPFVSNREWLDDFGEVLVVYWDAVYPDPVFGLDCCGNVTQYSSGLKIDFTLWPVELFQKIVAAPTLLDELEAGYQVLLDKDSLTLAMPSPTFKAYLPKPPTFEQYQRHINDFLSDAPYVAKCLRRGELMPLKWALDYDMKHVYLRQVLEWYVGVKHNWSVSVGSLGKGLKKVLPSDMWERLEQTYAAADIEENWKALENTLDLFRHVATDVGEHLGYAYPNELHERVVAYVERINHIESPKKSDK
jgi:aminoglycoside 6-adenylyltransferase